MAAAKDSTDDLVAQGGGGAVKLHTVKDSLDAQGTTLFTVETAQMLL